MRLRTPILTASAALTITLLCRAYANGWAQQTQTVAPANGAVTLRPLAPAVETPDAVYLPGKPEMIAGARFTEIFSNPQGKYALMVREEELPQPGALLADNATSGGTSLVLWDGIAHRARVVWDLPSLQGMQSGKVESVNWLAGTNLAVAIVETRLVNPATGKPGEERHSLLFLDPTRDVHTRLLYSQASNFWLNLSPTTPVGTLAGLEPPTPTAESPGKRPPSYFRVLTARGKLGPVLSLPPQTALYSWSDDGRTEHGRTIEMPPAPPGSGATQAQRPIRHYFAFDVETGQTHPLEKQPKEWDRLPEEGSKASLALSLIAPPTPVIGADKKPSGQTVHPLFLQAAGNKDASKALMIAPNADKSFLLNDLSAAFYVSQDAVYVVPIVALKPDLYEAALRSAYRARTMSQAKQLGLALMMYTQDYDDVLPPSDDLVNIVNPYLRNLDLFNDPGTGKLGFSYLMNGQEMKNISQPATTPIGVLTGPGGRAVVYADGHVKWEGQN